MKLYEGLEDISYASIARAIDRCVWWMEGRLGKGVKFPTIAAYLNSMDLRYPILISGANKTGFEVCLRVDRLK